MSRGAKMTTTSSPSSSMSSKPPSSSSSQRRRLLQQQNLFAPQTQSTSEGESLNRAKQHFTDDATGSDRMIKHREAKHVGSGASTILATSTSRSKHLIFPSRRQDSQYNDTLHASVSTGRHPSMQSARSFSLFRSSPSTKAPALQSVDGSGVDASVNYGSQQSRAAPHQDKNRSGQASTSSSPDAEAWNDRKESRKDTPESSLENLSSHVPPLDQINTLLRHPTMYDPILKPRHPIVLCHGLYGFDARGPSYFRLHYWGDLLAILRGTVGAEVVVTAVPGTGSIKQRAHTLHRLLEESEEAKGKQLNFLAHSMGGLDARYLFSQIRPENYHPVSLTTLSTPHRGSEFMSWCRANIGIGTDYDVTSAEAARLAHEDTSIPLPYSLKSPILNRVDTKKEEDAKKAVEKEKKAQAAANILKSGLNLSGLPKSLTASVSNYLLDLLDSPAYANLTPNFMREVFNPLTPDREGIKYYSIASRTDKIPIWHPLWLPKQVIDGAESARLAKGIKTRDDWIGNDGLVTIESAQWGEFLGVIENCDHWEMRGSSGLVSAAASASAITELAKMATRPGREDQAEDATDNKKGWKWQDLYKMIGNSRSKTPSPSPAAVAAASDAKVEEGKERSLSSSSSSSSSSQSDDTKGLNSMASWIVKVLPGIPSPITSSINSIASSAANTFSTTPQPSIVQDPRRGNLASSTRPSDIGPQPTTTKGSAAMTAAARLQYGAPVSKNQSGDSNPKSETSSKDPSLVAKLVGKVEKEKFSLEKMTIAICRKLYNDGL